MSRPPKDWEYLSSEELGAVAERLKKIAQSPICKKCKGLGFDGANSLNFCVPCDGIGRMLSNGLSRAVKQMEGLHAKKTKKRR